MTAKEILSFTIEEYYKQLPNQFRDDEIDEILNNWGVHSDYYIPSIFHSLARKVTQFETISRKFVKEDDLHSKNYVYRYKIKDKIFEVDLIYCNGEDDGGDYNFDLQSFREITN